LDEEPALAKVEYFSLTFFHPHSGHAGGDCLRFRTSFSKFLPHFGQAYSKIGMEEGGYSLLSGSHVLRLAFPDGD
jgi:hypothetical protein